MNVVPTPRPAFWRGARALLALAALVAPLPAPAAVPSPDAPSSFADLVAKVAPAVVNVAMAHKAEADGVGRLPLTPPGSPFDEFFKHFREQGENNTPGQLGEDDSGHDIAAVGSGFIISAEGMIVTNNHVIENAESISVTLQDGTRLPATVVGHDSKTDLAVIKVNAKTPLPFVTFGDSTKARVGDWVIAVGNPFGLGGTVSAGIISARGRDIHAGPFDDFLQINASINQGNSGGPTFDLDGKVIGINTAIYSPNGGSVGIGFAIPSDLARPLVEQLEASGHVERGWLGVQIQDVTQDIADSMNLSGPKGALVAVVTPGSPAAKAGLRQGDVIVSFGGQKIANVRELTRAVAQALALSSQSVDIVRGGKTQTVSVKVGAAPEATTQPASAEGGASADQPDTPAPSIEALGVQLAPLAPGDRGRLGLPEHVMGVLVTGLKEGVDSPLHLGDVILKVGDVVVKVPDDVRHQIDAVRKSGRKNALLLVNRHGNEQFIAVPLEGKLK